MYSIGTAYRLMSYVGNKPWTNDQVSEVDLPILPDVIASARRRESATLLELYCLHMRFDFEVSNS